MNGTSPHVHARLGNGKLIDRHEYVRLLEQALGSLGFHEAAERLQRDSGISLEPVEVSNLRSAVAAGDFDTAVTIIEQLPISTPDTVQQAKFLVWQQEYLEAVEGHETSAAVDCLRTKLARLVPPCDASRLQLLSTCLLAQSAAELHRLAGLMPGSTARSSRSQLIADLQTIVPPALMLPERRLETLIEQALAAQLSASRYHNSVSSMCSLLSDYDVSAIQLPSRTSQVLREHSDEVWHLAFSNNGRFLASGCKDGSACIWEVVPQQLTSVEGGSGGPLEATQGSSNSGSGSSSGAASSSLLRKGSQMQAKQLVLRHTLKGHTDAVLFVAWSPDDSSLATCSLDSKLKIWDTATGSCRQVIQEHLAEVTAAAWLPSGDSIISCSHDKYLYMHSITGELQQSWRDHRLNDIVLVTSRESSFLVATPAGDSCVRLYHLDGTLKAVLRCETSLMSTTVSQDLTSLLVYMSDGRIVLARLPVDVNDGREVPLESLVTYEGSRQPDKTGRWLIRSCFGGVHQRFVLSGSEECKVYVWHRESGEMVKQLDGHTGTVNSVAWNPIVHTMFASASDDNTIRVWAPE